MKNTNWFTSKLEAFKEDFEFRFEALVLDLTENICKRMAHENISRTEFAKRLSVSPPAVTKILRGNSNFTLKTLLSIADALGQELSIDFKEKEAVVSPHLTKVVIHQPFVPLESDFTCTREMPLAADATIHEKYVNMLGDTCYTWPGIQTNAS